jgi:hypothetical protein
MAKLTVNESAAGYTHEYAFDFNDLKASGFLSNLGAANQRQIGWANPGDVIDLCAVINTVAEAGSTTLTLDVGITNTDPDEFIDNLDLDGLTKATFNTGDAFAVTATGATIPAVGYVNNTATGTSILMEVNPVDSTGVTALTAGAWVIRWRQAESGIVA